MSGCSESAERAEARRVAIALVCAVLDGDDQGATVLLANSSFEVVAQAAVDRARGLADSIDGDPAEFRAGLAGALQLE